MGRAIRRALFAVLLLQAGLGGGACRAAIAEAADAQPDPARLVEQALAYEHGEGVSRDPEKAHDLYCQAVRQGSAEAMYGLGWMYANGRGVARDDGIAATLFEMSMAGGYPGADKARRMVGEYTGTVPDCLKPRNGETGLAAMERWNTVKYLASLPEHRKKVVELITTLAPRFSIEPRLALAIATTESNFDVNAKSPKNAMGVMQLIPETASRFNVKDSFDPVDNIKGGLAYLRWLLSYYQGNVALAVAGYNAGEGAVDRYKGIPPYKETQNYVRRILDFFPRTDHPFDARVVGPSPMLRTLRSASR